MRRALSPNASRKRYDALTSLCPAAGKSPRLAVARSPLRQFARSLANVRDDKELGELWFTSSFPKATTDPSGFNSPEDSPPDERALKLGKTVRILHERLPTLLLSPLPQEILSPQISLCLFPSTHPHLPTATGRIAYSAALWTAPVAWGRVPVVGNIALKILSERMVKNGPQSEKLIVRWQTCAKTKGRKIGDLYRGAAKGSEQTDTIKEVLGGTDADEFSGLFIFEFDEEGRVLRHIIEHAQEGGNWERFTKVVSVTDYLLGKAKGRKEPELALEYCPIEHRDRDPRDGTVRSYRDENS